MVQHLPRHFLPLFLCCFCLFLSPPPSYFVASAVKMSLFIPLPLYLNIHYTVYHMCVCVWVGVHGCIRCIQSVNTDIARIRWTKGDRVCFHPERLTIAHYIAFLVWYFTYTKGWRRPIENLMLPDVFIDVSEHVALPPATIVQLWQQSLCWSTSRVGFPGRLATVAGIDGRRKSRAWGGIFSQLFFSSFASPTYLHWTFLFESTFSFLQ